MAKTKSYGSVYNPTKVLSTIGEWVGRLPYTPPPSTVPFRMEATLFTPTGPSLRTRTRRGSRVSRRSV